MLTLTEEIKMPVMPRDACDAPVMSVMPRLGLDA
jgi:hypothetical protein